MPHPDDKYYTILWNKVLLCNITYRIKTIVCSITLMSLIVTLMLLY